jgi:uncharacterized damage-inducible protein DinB
MDAHAHFGLLARYGAWATRKLYQHVDALTDDEYRRDTGLFFKSVHGTLNHLLVAEHQLWYVRFAEGRSPSLKLNAEVETDRARLRERLLEASEAWGPLIAAWPAQRFEGRLDYVSTEGVQRSLPFAPTLAHVFNHGTHHRGQINAAITALAHECPELDLLFLIMAEARKA